VPLRDLHGKGAKRRISAPFGRPSLWLLSLGRARESNPPAVRGTAISFFMHAWSARSNGFSWVSHPQVLLLFDIRAQRDQPISGITKKSTTAPD
jgi:hypothetical protein